MTKSIWHFLHNVKSTVKISSICVAFLENMNFKTSKNSNAKLLFLHQGPMSSRFKGDCAIKDRLLNWGFFTDMIKLLLQYATLQLSAIDKMVFSFENCFGLLREKLFLWLRIFLQSPGWTFAKYPFIWTVKLQSCTEYFFNLLQERSNQT